MTDFLNAAGGMPLIATRLMPPRMVEGSLKRQRLLQHLYRGAERGGSLLVVNAPAGYGKSTLLAQCFQHLRETGQGVAWLTLEEDDNEEAQFFCYLAAALGSLSGDISSDLIERYLSGGNSFHGRRFVSELIQSIAAKSNPMALFLDDYHVIDTPSIHDALQYLLKHLPDNLTLVIGSRVPLPIPLAKLKASNKLVYLEGEDLRFDRQEAQSLFCETNQLSLSGEDLDLLYGSTGGWAAVMQLAALSVQGVDDLHKFLNTSLGASAGHRGSVSDFFAEEVVTQLPGPLADLLMRTAVVERLCVPLCRAITEDAETSEQLEHLWDTRFLLQGLDEQGYWYRLHPLFRNFLLRQLEIKCPAEIENLHRRASEWFEGEGFIGEAIQHALSGRDEARALELLEERGMRLMVQGHLPLVFSLVKRLPPGLLQGSQEVLIQLAWLQVLTNQLPGARCLLAELKASIGELDQNRQAEIYAIEIVLHFIDEEYTAVRQLLDIWLPKAPEEPIYIKGTLKLIQGFWHFNCFEYEQALNAVQWVLEKETQADIAYTQGCAACVSGLVHFACGHLKQAGMNLSREIDRLQESVGSSSQAVTLMEPMLGVMCYYRGDLARAQGLFEHGLDTQRVNASVDLVVIVLRASVRMLHYMGRHDEALEYLHEAQNLAEERGWQRLLACVMHERVRLYLALGERQQAEAAYRGWVKLKKSRPKAHQVLSRQGDEWERMAEARLSMAAGDTTKAAVMLKALLEQFLQHGRVMWAMEVLVLLAKAYMQVGQLPSAKQALVEALALDGENTVIQLFRDEGELVIDVLHALRADLQQCVGEESHQLWQQQIETIVHPVGVEEPEGSKAIPAGKREASTGAPDMGGGELVVSLTKRELATLALLVDGYSNKEISEQLSVSINTVKTHLQSAYAKLGVSRRTQAVRRLKELAVLD